jgi:EmrB/QacA subfamily drug resistance transporter
MSVISEPLTRVRAAGPAAPAAERRRWIALVFIALAQLMVVLDTTIVSIALPSAQAALRISNADRQWVITAYTLAFGGLLLIGGRVADYAGRKRAFLIGLIGFAAASAVGGAAADPAMLIGARAAQGAFGALLAPTVLSLLTVTFAEPRDRARAFAVFGAVASGGAALGLILGGVLTEYLSWRWCLYVNAPIAVVVAIGGAAVLPAVRPAGRPRLDGPGAVLAAGGLLSLVFAVSEAASHGWTSALVVGLLITAGALLTVFVWAEGRAASPLLPLRVVLDRNRGGAYLAVAFTVAGMYGLFLFLTFYLQVVRHYSPVGAGLAFLPLSAAVLVSSTVISSRLSPLVAPRALIAPGLVLGVGAMLVLTRLTVTGGFASHVLPAELLLGLGMGAVFATAFNTGTQRVAPRDAGVASAVLNTSQQAGGSIGTALLNTVAASVTTGYLATHRHAVTTALVHGYAVAAAVAAGLLGVAVLVSAILINAGKPIGGAGVVPRKPAEPEASR